MQPDSLIPDPSNSQAWNRYAYALNNPIRYNDPSGHDADCGIGDSYCSNAKHEYHEWRKYSDNSDFKIFLKAKDAYERYHRRPDIALKDQNNRGGTTWEDADPYTLAGIYSENVKHQLFNPIPDEVYFAEIDKQNAKLERGEGIDWWARGSIIFNILVMYGPDGGGGGGGAYDILMPGGVPVGIGRRPGVQEVSADELDQIWNALKVEGVESSRAGYKGIVIEFLDGGSVGLRDSTKGFGLTIDVWIDDIPFDKIHLPR